MEPNEFPIIERQILYNLLVHGEFKIDKYLFKIYRTPGTHTVSLYLDSKVIRSVPLQAIMSLVDHFLLINQDNSLLNKENCK